jgi:predicted nucleic acid-binding protein
MILIDTSVWIAVLRDRSGNLQEAVRSRIGSEVYALSRFNQLELLQGARDGREWLLLDDYLSTQLYLEAFETTWREAARIYFDLRRRGTTLASTVDCCIAQIAIENDATLLHRDRDFESIARVRPLSQEYFKWD